MLNLYMHSKFVVGQNRPLLDLVHRESIHSGHVVEVCFKLKEKLALGRFTATYVTCMVHGAYMLEYSPLPDKCL